MSKTIRRKNVSQEIKKSFLYDKSYLDENGLIKEFFNHEVAGLTLEKANEKMSAWFHSCTGPRLKCVHGKGYRQEYRAKSKQQLREQLNRMEDYDSVQIDKLCNDWKYWS